MPEAWHAHLKSAIAESVEYLEKSLHKARSATHKEKLQMLHWLKTGQVKQHQDLAQRLGRNPSTISRWLQQYRQSGLSALLALKTAPGKQAAIAGEMLE